jgi:hypothetical protein
MKLCALLPLTTLLFACAGCSQSTFQADGSIPDSGPAPDAAVGDFDYFALDPLPNNFTFLAMAVGPNDHVGVAYFLLGDGGVDSGILLPDGGLDTLQGQFEPNYYVQYVEYANGAVVSGPQRLPLWDNNACPPNGCIDNSSSVQLLEGITVAFQNNGQPIVGYIGGPNKDQSVYWFQQNATLNFRAADGQTWTEVSVDRFSSDIPPPAFYQPDPVDVFATAEVLGLYPSLAVDPDGGTVWFAYRDVHSGQFPKQDWLASDLKVAWGQPSDFTSAAEQGANSTDCYCTAHQTASGVGPNGCFAAAWDGNQKNAYGGHNHLVIGPNDLPAVVYDQIPGTGGGVNVDGFAVGFFMNQGGATWYPDFATGSFVQCVSGCQQIAASGNPGNTGPFLAYDPVNNSGTNGPGIGFGVAFTDLNLSTLFFTSSSDGATWVPQQAVFAYGSGAWYPSLLIDSTFHFPSIAFFFCSQSGGEPIGTPSACGAAQSPAFTPGVYIAEEPGADWDFVLVDPQGFYMPLIGQLSTGARVVVYDRGDGSLWLAQEKM